MKFFIIKFHSKPFFFRNCFVMLLFLTTCWWFYTLFEFVIFFWSHLTYLESLLDLVLYIRHNRDVIQFILVLTLPTFLEESYKLCILSRYALYHLLFQNFMNMHVVVSHIYVWFHHWVLRYMLDLLRKNTCCVLYFYANLDVLW